MEKLFFFYSAHGGTTPRAFTHSLTRRSDLAPLQKVDPRHASAEFKAHLSVEEWTTGKFVLVAQRRRGASRDYILVYL